MYAVSSGLNPQTQTGRTFVFDFEGEKYKICYTCLTHNKGGYLDNGNKNVLSNIPDIIKNFVLLTKRTGMVLIIKFVFPLLIMMTTEM